MATGTQSGGAAGRGSSNAHKFLSFNLGLEQYGVEILRVREIIGLIAITPLPRAPEHVRGVMNLRGRIIPVIDLRAKFGLPSVEATKETCIIVMDLGDGAGEAVAMGVVVDSVREVQDIGPECMEPAPAFGSTVPLDYILGMGKVGDRVIILLNITRILSAGEVGAVVEQAGTRAAA